MLLIKGRGMTGAGREKPFEGGIKINTNAPSRCYWCKSPHNNDGKIHCGKCEPSQNKAPTVVLKGNDFTRTTDYYKNNIDKETGQVVDRKKVSFKNYD